jgi:carbonic anhydrase
MEAHFVHTAADGLAVVGVLMVPSKSNAVFKKMVSTMAFGRKSGSPGRCSHLPHQVATAAARILPLQGTLTTLICSETGDWIVLTRPIEVDEADIALFGKRYAMNARPVLPRDRRFILSSGPR